MSFKSAILNCLSFCKIKPMAPSILWCSDVAVFLVSTEDGDRHSRPDGGTDRPRGGRGPEPHLPEGSKAEALSQAEEVNRMERTSLEKS